MVIVGKYEREIIDCISLSQGAFRIEMTYMKYDKKSDENQNLSSSYQYVTSHSLCYHSVQSNNRSIPDE